MASLEVFYGTPELSFYKIINYYEVREVYTNHDYEPGAINRDNIIKDLLAEKNIAFKSYKDQVIIEKDEVLKDDGTPYTVYSPYSRKWKSVFTDFYDKSYPTKKYHDNFFRQKNKYIPSLDEMGFQKTDQNFPSEHPGHELRKHKTNTRDFPQLVDTHS